MSAVYALYDSPETAQRAVDGLRAAGIEDRQITILSSAPLEGYELGERDHETAMPWIACLGGLVGFSVGVGLSALTQLSWPLVTGGMPIFAIWPSMIPIFELTMLGAVLATVATFVVTSLLPSERSPIYDPAISEGKILVGVAKSETVLGEDLERAFQGGQVKRIG